MIMIDKSRTAYQMSYRLICQMLRRVLREQRASGGVGSVACRATAVLYALLLSHPVDRRGRCAACGWAGAVFERRRRCRIYRVAHYWLHQPYPALVTSLASELGVSGLPPVVRPEPDWPSLTVTGRTEQDGTGPDDTEVLPRIEAQLPDPDADQGADQSVDQGVEFSPAPVLSPAGSRLSELMASELMTLMTGEALCPA